MPQSNEPTRRPLHLVLVLGGLVACAGAASGDQNIGLRVPPGFEVTRFADDDLAHDIFAMTTDALGRIVVAGPRYIRILEDTDGDGRADRFQHFSDGPPGGAQGLAFVGRGLLCVGGEGLLLYRDADADDRADGAPSVFLKIATGGEHNAHAVRRGPDGWWYLIAGNTANVDDSYATLPTSPVRHPQAGVLLRLKPDLSGGEIVADGLRNAYDFAFHPQGEIFTYDSDDERDVSLPWYRPTRVFQLLPGSSTGWVSRSWKHPDDFFEMPPVAASLGRGSPTGVECYRHTQFPEPYRGALFVLDWTFGRVVALPLQRDGAAWSGDPIPFMAGIGQFGFAPTDVVVGPEGSLYVSVGGRGTRGGVFRVTYPAGAAAPPAELDPLTACLTAPQPLCAWSRAEWLPAAEQLGRDAFRRAAADAQRPAEQRVRAIEILTELFGGLDAETGRQLASAESAAVRARAAWSLGRTADAPHAVELLALLAGSDDAWTARAALEGLLGLPSDADVSLLEAPLRKQLGAPSRYVRQAAARLLERVRARQQADFGPGMQDLASGHARAAFLFGSLERVGQGAVGVDLASLRSALELLSQEQAAPQVRLEAARLAQLALGDVGPMEKRPPVFDGYASRFDLGRYERELDTARIAVAEAYPSGDARLDQELGRLAAMLAPAHSRLLERVLAALTRESHPVDDIHQLIVAARIPVERTPAQRARIADALLALDAKIASRRLNQDTSWEDRVGEMYAELVRHDPDLPDALLKHPEFGRPAHANFLRELPRTRRVEAAAAFVHQSRQTAEYAWNPDTLLLLGESNDAAHREIIRGQFDNFALRNVVLLILAKSPEPADRDKFVAGLESAVLEVLAACVQALAELPASQDADEQMALLSLLRRLGADKSEYPLRERVVKLLQRNSGLELPFVFGEAGHVPQREAVEAWTAALTDRYPEAAARALGSVAGELEQLRAVLAEVDWDRGDAERGRVLFEKRSCAQCHGGRSALGPDLAGVARRFSRDDVFTAIAAPNRDVSPRYQTTLVQTTAGKVYTGLVVYDSVDGVTLRDGMNLTYRIEAGDIELRRTLNTSLMPAGLLKDLTPGDLADLYAYLAQVGGQ